MGRYILLLMLVKNGVLICIEIYISSIYLSGGNTGQNKGIENLYDLFRLTIELPIWGVDKLNNTPRVITNPFILHYTFS